MSDIDDLVRYYDLKPHPEGGYYKETFRSDIMVQTQEGQRSSGTAIVYLLSGSDVSHFHKIDADEIWHFHQGGPLAIHSLKSDGTTTVDILAIKNPQIVIKAGVWFGATLVDPNSYCLAGCTVSPAFSFEGFELAKRSDLLSQWPEARDIILHLTAED